MRGGEDAEATVRAAGALGSRPPRPADSGKRMLLWAAVASGLVVFAAIYFAFLVPPRFQIRSAGRAGILAADPRHLLIFRYSNDPNVVVLDFPNLHQQGEMLNRVAAFVEKAGAPHNRVLTDSELAAAIRASGATPDTYYYGHDYRAADLVRFFHLMARDHVAPDPEERRLRALLAQLHWFAPGAVGAMITLPGPGKAPGLDERGRATILEHELSHGAYFTIPAYDVYANHFFHDVLSPQDRALFRRFLAGEGYDTRITDLVINETQAYLMFTPDPRFFSAALVGLTRARLEALRAIFWRGIPLGWLKRSVPPPGPVPGPIPAAGGTAVAKPRRRRQGFARVVRRRAVASKGSCAASAAARVAARAGR